MAFQPLGATDKSAVANADHRVIQAQLATLGSHGVPPWLRPENARQDGSVPRAAAAFANVSKEDLVEILAIRGPLHALDGWSYVGRALNALIAGDSHATRHLAYYGELRGALSLLASSGIGIFNSQNVCIDQNRDVWLMSSRGTHDMCWATIVEWAQRAGSVDRLISPMMLAGSSMLDAFREFFPSATSAAAAYLMEEWGFDLEQGADDQTERNWSSYQPTALLPQQTSPIEDTLFLRMFWEALRPGAIGLDRHLFRILLEAEFRANGEALPDFSSRYSRLDDVLQTAVPLPFLTREDEPYDHPFLCHAAKRNSPAHPYSMLCRAALLLKFATGMAEANLQAAGIRPTQHFESWWHGFGIEHGLWSPEAPPVLPEELWSDIDVALEDIEAAPANNRHGWTLALRGSAFRVCETERAALWGLFR
ncbi:hypothetical protein NKW84_15545 [Acetobacter senegalensis]|uniref:Uncharacterized protein n=1 Tax=Acetobacter tropicalis TaxID=104102 RepID=A0A252A4L6_9PROT|nr:MULTISPECIES: hypothetical protein [Acetobacter]MCP1197261.1 hypothetical protein [Acetobacter senegalensis]OUI84378.1 hypothetical protein HC62_13280 [Acetobacter tropicalis]